MASEAPVAEQSTDETEGCKVIDDAKFVEEDGVFQTKQAAGSEIGKDKVEELSSSETSTVDFKEMIENKDEASAIEAAMKEDEGDMTSASGVLEDKKVDAPAADDVKKETEGPEASGSDALGDNKDDVSVVEDVKKEAEICKTSSLSDADVEASIKDPEEKPISTTEPLSEEMEKTLLDSSSTSVQESEQVGYEPEVSEPVVKTTKSIKESLDTSTTPELASKAVVKSEEHPVAFIVTEPAPDAVGEPERKSDTSEADDLVVASKDESIVCVDENIASVQGETASEPSKEESAVDPESSASQALDTVPGDSAEVEAEDVGKIPVSENTKKARDDVNAGECPVDAKNEEGEHNATESLGKEVTIDTSLPSPSIAVGETEAVDATSITEAAEIVVKAETDTEEQKEEKTVEMELVQEQNQEKTVEEDPIKEQEGEKGVQTGSTLTAAKETEASSEEKLSKGADKVFEQTDLGISVSATESIENLEKGKVSEVAGEFAEEPKHGNENIDDKTALVQASGDMDQIGPATEVAEAPSEEEKPSKGIDKVVEQRDLAVAASATESTENLEKVKDSEVARESAEELDQENENIEDYTPLAQTSRDIDLWGQGDETDTSIREPVVKLEAEKSVVDTVQKDETKEKTGAEKSDAQELVEPSKDGTDSITNPEVQKAETSSKPSKTLMSKVKHSIVKVKKAIIGKSPSTKTISADAKDELKVK